jgi:hypothetical protein
MENENMITAGVMDVKTNLSRYLVISRQGKTF